MADKYKEKAKIFDQVNALYAEYSEALGRENVEVYKKAVATKIIVLIWNMFKKEYDCSVAIVTVVNKCLDKFPNSENAKNGGKFSAYVCEAVKRKLKTEKGKAEMSENTGGAKVSDKDFRAAKEVKKRDEEFQKLGWNNENQRNTKIAILMNMTTAEVERLKSLYSNRTQSLDSPVKGKNGDKQNISDRLAVGNMPSPEEKYFQEQVWREILGLIQKEWEKKRARRLSKLLTVRILSTWFPRKDNRKNKKSEILENGSAKQISRRFCDFEEEFFDPRKIIKDYSFFDKSILKVIFTDEDYDLPTQKEIMNEEGKSNTQASRDIREFFKKVKSRFDELNKDDKDAKENLFAQKFFQKVVNFMH